LKAKLEKKSRSIWKFTCEATVAGELVTTADMLCAATEKE